MFVVIETKNKISNQDQSVDLKKERIIRKECMLLSRVFTLFWEL